MAENTEKNRVFCNPPAAISLWTAPESAIFTGFSQVKALPTPEITGFARLRGAQKQRFGANQMPRARRPCATSQARDGLRGGATPLQVSKMIVQNAAPFENDLGSHSKVTSTKARRAAGGPLYEPRRL